MNLSYETENSLPLLDDITTLLDAGIQCTKADLEKAGFIKEIESLDDLKDLLDSDEPLVYAKITAPLELAANDAIEVQAGKEVFIELDNKISCVQRGFVVEDGGSLTLSGTGTIETSNKSTKGAIIEAKGKDAIVTVEGVTLDAVTVNGKQNNYAYGIYLSDEASLNFKSGTIKCAYGSCISTNNTTGGATVVNISGGELLCDGSYAIYCPSQVTFNITGGKVQGINARMGIFNISDDAEIIGTTITDDDYDDIGLNIATSGCIWLGDTIAIVAGTYTDEDGTDCRVTISGNATVHSSYRSAIGIYEVDTNAEQYVQVNVAVPTNVETTAEGYSDIEVYDHEYIAERAAAYSKQYDPTVQSVVEINTP